MDEQNKIDEKLKWMKKMEEQNIMDEHNLFVTKSYVPMLTLPFHNQEVCVNPNTIYSFPRGMFPLKIETILGCTFSISFHTIFYLNSVYQTFYI
jgi:hypothetical protein